MRFETCFKIGNVLNMFDLNPFAEENSGLSRQSTKQAVRCKVYALERARVMKQVPNLCLQGGYCGDECHTPM